MPKNVFVPERILESSFLLPPLLRQYKEELGGCAFVCTNTPFWRHNNHLPKPASMTTKKHFHILKTHCKNLKLCGWASWLHMSKINKPIHNKLITPIPTEHARHICIFNDSLLFCVCEWANMNEKVSRHIDAQPDPCCSGFIFTFIFLSKMAHLP